MADKNRHLDPRFRSNEENPNNTYVKSYDYDGFNYMAFGSRFGYLQALFDEKINDADVANNLWANAWGRAVAYAWESEAQKRELLEDPDSVLQKVAQYSTPDGLKLIVIDANAETKISIIRKETNESTKVGFTDYNNPFGGEVYYPVLIKNVNLAEDKHKVLFEFEGKDGEGKLTNAEKFKEISGHNPYPINGWVNIPREGMVGFGPDGGPFWVTTEDEFNKVYDNGNFNPENYEKTGIAPTVTQYLNIPKGDRVHLNWDHDKGELVVEELDDDRKPSYFRLASTIIMTLPPQPENAVKSATSLIEYGALGKIYPFTT